MPRLLVVDDDPDLIKMLTLGLTQAGYEVETATSADQGLTIAFARPPDLIVLDILMQWVDGIEALRRLRAAGLPTPVLLLTAKNAAEDEVNGLSCGADDYLKKPFIFEVLLARVKALLRRYDTRTVLQYSDLRLDTASRIALRERREIRLTKLEYRLLHEFLEHPQHVLSKDLLLDRVWGFHVGSPNVVEVYVKQLRRKLEAAGEPRLIHTSHGMGYVLREA